MTLVHYRFGYAPRSLCERAGLTTDDDRVVTCQRCIGELRRMDDIAARTMQRDAQPARPLLSSGTFALSGPRARFRRGQP